MTKDKAQTVVREALAYTEADGMILLVAPNKQIMEAVPIWDIDEATDIEQIAAHSVIPFADRTEAGAYAVYATSE